MAALKKYIADNGAAPATLKALVPKYLRRIPRCTVGDKAWHYDAGAKDYSLIVHESPGSLPHWYTYGGPWQHEQS